METPSTRNVTATTVTPMGVLGVAVSTTMRFTMAPGAVSVIEEVVGGGVVGGVAVGGWGVGRVVAGGVVVVGPALAGGWVAAAAGGVVTLLSQQPARTGD